jgi:hypothetical protein
MPDPYRYLPGPGWAVTASSLVVLFDSEIPQSLLAAVWEAARGSDGPQAVLDALLGTGLRSVPSFGLADRADDGFHVFVRGGIEAVVDEQGPDEQSITAHGALTWTEQAVPASTALTLRLGPSREGQWLPLAEGIVQAAAVAMAPNSLRPSEATGPVSGVASQSGILVSPVETPVLEDEVMDPGARGMSDGNVDVDVRAPAEGGSADALVIDRALPRGDQADAFETLVELPVERGGDAGPEPGTGAAHGAVGPELVDEIDDYEDLFGATRASLLVEHAAVRPEVESAESGGQEDAAGEVSSRAASTASSATSAEVVPAGPRPEPVVTMPPSPASGLIDAVPLGAAMASTDAVTDAPWGSPAVASPDVTVAAEPVSVVDDDLATVSRASLRAARGAPSLSEAVAGPPVHGLWCINGHANPPTATRCRQCQAAIELVDPVTMPRPVLGSLEFSNGQRVVLDRPAVIGRSPRSERVSASEIPQLVVVPSPGADISRSHLEVRIEGWHVLVVDLDSTNGTVVMAPGQEPQRLRPKEEVPISPGTVVSLADEVAFTYVVGS